MISLKEGSLGTLDPKLAGQNILRINYHQRNINEKIEHYDRLRQLLLLNEKLSLECQDEIIEEFEGADKDNGIGPLTPFQAPKEA